MGVGVKPIRACLCLWSQRLSLLWCSPAGAVQLELELIQSHVAQKQVLRGEVGCACVAREVSVERGGMGERNAPHDSGMCWKQFMMCLEDT